MAIEKYKQVVVKKITRETYDTSSFELEAVEERIPARAGQFLTFVMNSHTGKEIRRSYSLSSSPETGEPLTVTVKRIPNGEISRYFLDRLKVGDLLRTIGASGFFVLPENIAEYTTCFFFAAGSGITPVYSLLKTLLHSSNGVRAVLVYSNRNHAETIFYQALKELQERFPRTLEVHLLFSHANDLNRSRLTPVLVENLVYPYLKDFPRSLFYICGPNAYMRMVQYTLLSIGVPAPHVKREIFFVQPPAAKPVPPDTSKHGVTLVTSETTYRFDVQYPVSILQAARSRNIPLPFSCETGQCGTCVARCLQGQVWMSRNEILLDDELAGHQVLTCTGFPVHGDVTLTI